VSIYTTKVPCIWLGFGAWTTTLSLLSFVVAIGNLSFCIANQQIDLISFVSIWVHAWQNVKLKDLKVFSSCEMEGSIWIKMGSWPLLLHWTEKK